jgi:DNA replication protein DnaC
VIDDYLLRPLSADQAADVLEVVEDRAGLRSTIITSQLPIALWHQAMGEPTVADAVMDRVLQHLHRIELVGESMRRPEGASKTSSDEQDANGSRAKRTTRSASAHEADAPANDDPQ